MSLMALNEAEWVTRLFTYLTTQASHEEQCLTRRKVLEEGNGA